MEAFLLFLIGLLVGHAAASDGPKAASSEARSDVAEIVVPCRPMLDSTWIADLTDPEAPRWIVQDAGQFCSPVTGERVQIHDGSEAQ